MAGRLFYGPVLTRFSARTRTVATLAAASLTTLALAVVHQPVAVVCTLSFGAGIARGIFTLIQATAISDRWGTQDFGARNGILSGAVRAAAAFAPLGGHAPGIGVGKLCVGLRRAGASGASWPPLWCVRTRIRSRLQRPLGTHWGHTTPGGGLHVGGAGAVGQAFSSPTCRAWSGTVPAREHGCRSRLEVEVGLAAHVHRHARRAAAGGMGTGSCTDGSPCPPAAAELHTPARRPPSLGEGCRVRRPAHSRARCCWSRTLATKYSLQEPRVSRPGDHQGVARNASCGVPQQEDDCDDVVQRPDDRQELRQQVDR